MFRVKISILDALKNAGFTSYTIRRDKVFGEATMQKFRSGGLPSWNELDKLCTLLDCNPLDIIEYVKTDGDKDNKDRLQKLDIDNNKTGE